MAPGAYACIDEIPLSLTGKRNPHKLKQITLSLTADQLFFSETSPDHSPIIGDLANRNSQMNINRDESHETINGSKPYTDFNGDDRHYENGHRVASGSVAHVKLEKLKTLSSEVLNVELGTIRLSDTFFYYGGDSLTAIKLVGAATC